MGFALTYKTLFKVNILHHYFLNNASEVFDNMNDKGKSKMLKEYDVSDFISIEPTPSCAAIIRKNHFIFRTTPFGLIVGIRVRKEATKYFPEIVPDNDLRFTFNLHFNDGYFSNYTALPLSHAKGTLFYFSNLKTNAPKKFPNVTQFAPQFVAGQKYSAGDMVSDNSNNPTKIFIAKKLNANSPPHANWINDDLVAGKPLQYANQQDLLPYYTDCIRYNTGQAGLNLTVKIKNRWGDTITPEFIQLIENDKIVALVDIHFLPEDFYAIKLEDNAKPYSSEFSFYRLPPASDADALLDLSFKSDESTYNMTDVDGSLRSPVYELRFKNRSTLWRYLGLKFTNLPESGPHPLTKAGIVEITIKDKDNNDVSDVPNPNIRMVKTEHPTNDNQHYDVVSEIFIN